MICRVCGRTVTVDVYQLDGTVRPLHQLCGNLLVHYAEPTMDKATVFLDQVFTPVTEPMGHGR